ncbi:hypothetical protein GUITHDRAFT_166484 [Guillardia theta CCMP2712]|uniref:Uncharacterized protein n=1 Tax=Guillardia theta (strain CCMP2712) TaxID=905079 RepID=L1IAW2_GUITC|nr:hypothetical protein GUITHDRAFT_166484 [Guillardia theta CCMP2712]EKX33386.1 hypothetical protein GUITHDRAFT_166484 [Guillardia theta CCMP2712]|eukprot:XP_005820366.1 hypothetical protein GUITHDRAFT_166484 [Guillardia theta CCMP2712]
MAAPNLWDVFGRKKFDRMVLGKPEDEGGSEICKGIRVRMFEEYQASTHYLRKDLGRFKQQGVSGTVVRVLPGKFACEVEWENGQRGIYFMSALYAFNTEEKVKDKGGEGKLDMVAQQEQSKARMSANMANSMSFQQMRAKFKNSQ